jgi:hypothetical protein
VCGPGTAIIFEPKTHCFPSRTARRLLRSRLGVLGVRCCCSAIVQPAGDIVHNPVETSDKVVASYGTTRHYLPLVRLYRSKVEKLR